MRTDATDQLFAMVPEMALRDAVVAPSAIALRVLGRMCFRGGTDGLCWEKQSMIAAALGVGTKRVYEATSLLERAGWITEIGGASKTGRTFRINREFIPEPFRFPDNPAFEPDRVKAVRDGTAVSHPVQRTISEGTNHVSHPVQRTFTSGAAGDKSCFSPGTADEHKNRPPKRTDPGTDPLFHGVGDDFAEWYRQYPKKKSPDAAEKAYRAVRKRGISREELLGGAMRYAAERQGEDPKFTKHPATWLNQGCWADEPAQKYDPPAATEGRRSGKPSPHDQLLAGGLGAIAIVKATPPPPLPETAEQLVARLQAGRK